MENAYLCIGILEVPGSTYAALSLKALVLIALLLWQGAADFGELRCFLLGWVKERLWVTDWFLKKERAVGSYGRA